MFVNSPKAFADINLNVKNLLTYNLIEILTAYF